MHVIGLLGVRRQLRGARIKTMAFFDTGAGLSARLGIVIRAYSASPWRRTISLSSTVYCDPNASIHFRANSENVRIFETWHCAEIVRGIGCKPRTIVAQFRGGRSSLSIKTVTYGHGTRVVIPVVVGSSPIGHPTKSRVAGWFPCNPFSLFRCVPAMHGLPLKARRSPRSRVRRSVHRGAAGGVAGLASREACVQYVMPAGAKLVFRGKQASATPLGGLLDCPSLPRHRRQRLTN